MPITILDGVVLFVVLLSAGLAMVRGFTREVLSIASWGVAAAAAFFLYPTGLPYAQQYIDNDTIALVATIAVIFLLTLILVSYITMRISDFILDSRIGALDRALGFVFGAARGLLLLVVAMAFFNWFVPDDNQPVWVAESKSKPILTNLGERLITMLPEQTVNEFVNRFMNRGGDGQADGG